jgi:hypothetical protein
VEYTGVTDNTSESTITSVDTNWSSGWNGSGVTGWNYVGQIGQLPNGSSGAGGVYLGDGWVITADHVGSSNFTLAGQTYSVIGSSVVTLKYDNTTTSSDLRMFQISGAPTLASLTVNSSSSLIDQGPSFVTIGYGTNGGNARAESWGIDTITAIDPALTPDGTSYVSHDFISDNTYSSPNGTVTCSVVMGDSGGGVFIYDDSSKSWVLAGINEVEGTMTDGTPISGYVDLSYYSDQIQTIMATPEPSAGLLIVAGAGLIFLALRKPQRSD